jgi:uncharacterized delta-60 repeat protein
VLSSPGSLDPNFGVGGLVTTSFGGAADFASKEVTQSDGKIVVVGTDSTANFATSQIALARYNRDGSLDTTFGSGGKVLALFGPTDFVTGAVSRPDGKIIVEGAELVNPATFQYENLLVQFNSDGTLDTSFGNGGSVVSSALAFGVITLGPSGQIVVASGGFNLVVAEYNPDGSLNQNFGTGGIVSTNSLPGTPTQFDPLGVYTQPQIFAAAVDSQGRVLVAGESFESPLLRGPDATLLRFNADGTSDKTFGNNGGITDVFGNSGFVASAIALRSDGQIIVAGSAGNAAATTNDLAVAQLNPDGGPDLQFGFDGIALTGVSTGLIEPPVSLAVQSSGDLVVAGSTFNFNPQTFTFTFGLGMARYTPDGSLDLTFGTNGIVTTFFSNPNTFFAGVAVVPGGDIVAAASTPDPVTGNFDFGVAEYMGNPPGHAPNTPGVPSGAPSQGTAGSLNPAFGTNGAVNSTLGSFETGLATQADGQIVAVGTDGVSIQVVRFNPDGSPDQTFGSGGAVSTLIGSTDNFESVAIRPDGKIDVAAVETDSVTSASNILLVQYNPDGSLDQSFGSGGSVLTSLPNGQNFTVGGVMSDLIHVGLAIGPDSQIIVTGGASGGTGAAGLVVAEYDRSGNLVTSFGSGGLVITPTFSDSAGNTFINPSGNAVTVDGRGRIVVAGTAAPSPGPFNPAVALLARYNADGSLDNKFGFQGAVTSVFDGPPNNDYVPVGISANAVAIRPDGRIVVSGDASAPPSISGIGGLSFESFSSFAVEQYNSDGSPDPHFGSHAIALYSVPFNFIATFDATSMVLQPNGDVVVAGTTNYSPVPFDAFLVDTHFAMIRLLPDGSFDTSFGPRGVVTQTFPNASFSNMFVALEPNGNIVAGGSAVNAANFGEFEFGLAEYLGDPPDPAQSGLKVAGNALSTATSSSDLAAAIPSSTANASPSQTSSFATPSVATSLPVGSNQLAADHSAERAAFFAALSGGSAHSAAGNTLDALESSAIDALFATIT